MPEKMMTLDEFRATANPRPDLGEPTSDESLVGSPGLTYLGYLYIQERPMEGWPNGRTERWLLNIGAESWLSDDLPRLEALLYEYAAAEEILLIE